MKAAKEKSSGGLDHLGLEMLEAIGKSTPDSVFVTSRAGRMLDASPGTLRAADKTPDQVLGRLDTEWHPNFEEAKVLMANDRRVMEGGQPHPVWQPWIDRDRAMSRSGHRCFPGY